VAADTFLVERRERRLEAVQILDLVLGFANGFVKLATWVSKPARSVQTFSDA